MMHWGHPENFVWLWVLAAAAFAFWLSSARKRRLMRSFGEVELIERLVSSLSHPKRLLKRLFILSSLFFIVTTLCQPHFSKKETLVERRGLDVIIAIDVSNSMLARDIAPSRLEKAKLELAGFIDRLKGDRIGIVAFAGDAYIQCPLTLDRSAAKLFLSTVSPGLVTLQGTSLSAAIKTATRAFSEKEKEFKALVLLTDGEDHEGAAIDAAKKARETGVRIFTIGIGTPEGRTIPDESGKGIKKDRAGNPIVSKLNESLLKEIAQAAGGRYFRSARGDLEVDRIAGELERLGKKALRSELSVEYDEHFQIFLLVAFLLLLFEMAVSERQRAAAFERRPAEAAAVTAALLFTMPFLLGFNAASALKNEEGNNYYKKNQVGKAKRAYLAAAKSDPHSPEVAYNLGNAYFKEESDKLAVQSYERASKDRRDSLLESKAFYNLGNALARGNDVDRAIEAYKEALRLNPKDKDAKYNLEILTRRKAEEKKNPPPKKDQQQNQQNQQDKQNQQNQENQQGGGGKSQEDKGQSQESQSQSQEEKSSEENEEGQSQENQSQKDKEKQEEKESQADQQKNQEGQEGQEQDQQKQEEKEGSRGAQEQQPSGGEEEKEETQAGEKTEEKPKSEAEIRAEQILGALENQERQVLKLGNEQRKGTFRRVNEKDW